ncbi:MAG: sigma-70 family RNA polymerase sigma factor [Myxococcota bacterium]
MPHSRAHQHEVATLVEAIGGSPSAFEQLYDRYADKVRYAVARAALQRGRTQEIDELTQEVWCRMLDDDRRLLRHYDPRRGRLAPFISMVAYQQALLVTRRHQRHSERVEAEVDDETFVDGKSSRFVEELIHGELFYKLIKRANAELREGDRMLLRALYLDQKTYRSIASQLGVSPNAIYKRSERLKKKLADMVEELLHIPPSSPSEPQMSAALALVVFAFSTVMPSELPSEVSSEVPSELPSELPIEVNVGLREEAIHLASELQRTNEANTESMR